MTHPNPGLSQVIIAPSRQSSTGRVSIFLAGTTTSDPTRPDWRKALTNALSHMPVSILNPFRSDWQKLLPEDASHPPFREQVEWELDMQERASMLVVYFGAKTDAPVSLLELGLAAGRKEVIVVCEKGYRKKGNVELVCQRYKIPVLDGDGEWIGEVGKRVERVIEQGSDLVST